MLVPKRQPPASEALAQAYHLGDFLQFRRGVETGLEPVVRNPAAERAQYFDVINIKLDKCGGLTEALQMARAARLFGKQLMVGNMGGSTLAMAPGFVLGQICDVVDLDGPYGLADDPDASRIYNAGNIFVPEAIWGCG